MSAPLETWQVGPWNRWAYVHVGEVVDTVPVPRGDGPIAQLERGAAGLDDLVNPLLETTYVDGLAVVHRGRLVAERYGGEMMETSLHLSQSVGKSVLGLLVGVLVARGALDTEERLTERVPEVADSGYAGATVQHLLDMTAAIDFVEDYAVDFWRYDIACGWHPPVAGVEARTILEFVPTIGAAEWCHGERFHYATPNTDLLGLVAEGGRGVLPAAWIERLGRGSSRRAPTRSIRPCSSLSSVTASSAGAPASGADIGAYPAWSADEAQDVGRAVRREDVARRRVLHDRAAGARAGSAPRARVAVDATARAGGAPAAAIR